MKKQLFALLVLLALVISACGGSGSDSNAITVHEIPGDYAGWTNPLGPEAASAGAKIFEINCVSCHGPTGRGDGTTADFLSPRPANLHAVNKLAGEDFVYFAVMDGIEGTAMVSWKNTLSDEEIYQLVAYVRTLE